MVHIELNSNENIAASEISLHNYRYLERETGIDAQNFVSLIEHINKLIHPNSLQLGPNVISLGCGQARDAAVIRKIFKSQSIGNENFIYCGIDISSYDLAEARNVYQDQLLTNKKQEFKFIEADINTLPLDSELWGSADFVILRHQYGFAQPEIWTNIFDRGFNMLKPKGKLMFTSFAEYEHIPTLSYVRECGQRELVTLENRFARTMRMETEEKPSMKVDCFVSLFEKTKT
jgi:SAM-dependent methyltransferase